MGKMSEHAARKFEGAHGQIKIAGSNPARDMNVFFSYQSYDVL
jgi:hypothetical protein